MRAFVKVQDHPEIVHTWKDFNMVLCLKHCLLSHLILLGFRRLFKWLWNFPCGYFTPEKSTLATNILCTAEGKSEEESRRLERRGKTCHPIFTVTFLLRNNIYIVSCWTVMKNTPADMKETHSVQHMSGHAIQLNECQVGHV